MTRILVTGATGFIGSQLCKRLKEKYDVHALVREDFFDRNRIGGMEYHKGDLLSYDSIVAVVNEVSPQVVVHLAAYTPVRFSYAHPEAYALNNYIGTINIVEACLKRGNIEQFVFASTGEVYGPKRRKYHKSTSEDTCPDPKSPYAISKYAGDLYVRYAHERGASYTILRATNTYGRPFELPEEARGYFIERCVIGMLSSNLVQFDGYSQSERRWMYVDDHVAAYLAVIENEKAYNQVFNVSTPWRATLYQVAEEVARLTGFKGKVEWGAMPRPIDPNYLDISSEKIRRVLGWEPNFDLGVGLARTVEYWAGLKVVKHQA